MGRKIFLGLLIIVILPFIFVAKTWAQTNNPSGVNHVLPKDEVINDNYFAAGNIVEIYGKINQDAYIAGGEITIDGQIEGDLLVVGGNIKIRGVVKNNIRAVGGQITIDGEVGKNVTAVGGTITLSPLAKIGGSIVSAGGSVSLDSPIAKTALMAGGNIVISSTVGGNTKIYSDSIRFTPSASIGGNLDYWTTDEGEISIDQKAKILGSVNKNTITAPTTANPEKLSLEARKGLMSTLNTFKIISLFSFLLVGLLFIKLFPFFTKNTTSLLEKKTWSCLGLGFIVLFLSPIAFIVLLISIIGLPFAFIGLAILGVFSYLSKLFLILWVGGKILANKKEVSQSNKFIVGLIVYAVLVFIPIVSGFTRLFTLLFGLGAILISLKEAWQKQPQTKQA